MNESLARLITLRRSRRTKLPPWWAVALLYGLPAAFCLQYLNEGGAIFLATTTLGLLVGLPLFFFKTETSLMATLRKGRCLEEMVAAGMSPASLIDTLAIHSLIPISRVCLRVTPILLIGSLMAPSVFVKPLLLLILSWPVAVAVFFASGSYLYQARSLLIETWGASSFQLGGLAALTLASASLVPAYPANGMLLFLILLAWTAWRARSIAVDALQNPVGLEQPSQGLFARRGHRNRWIPVWSDNFIVVRECARNASLKGGLRGYLGVRLLAIVLPLILGLYVTGEGDVEQCVVRLWRVLPLLGLLYFCRSAGRTLGAVAQERGQKTWETLVQTGVSYSDFREGWVQMGTIPYLLDSLPVLVFIFLFSLGSSLSEVLPSSLLGLFICLALGWLAWLGANVGLALSANSRNLQEAGAGLMGLLAVAGITWLGLWGAAYFLGRELMDRYYLEWWRYWEAVGLYLLPLASLVIVGVGVQAWARRRLAVGLSECELPAPRTATPSLFPLLGGSASGGVGALWLMNYPQLSIRLDASDWLVGATLGVAIGFLVYRSRLSNPLAPLVAGGLAGVSVMLLFRLVLIPMGMYDLTFHYAAAPSLWASARTAIGVGALAGVPWALGAYCRREILGSD